MILAMLGMFPFQLATVPFQETTDSKNWRYATNEVVGDAPKYQYIGKGEITKQITAVLMPEISGGDNAIKILESMADSGKSFPFILGTGELEGMFFIESMTENRSFFFNDGKARRIAYDLSLKRTYDDSSLNDGLEFIRSIL